MAVASRGWHDFLHLAVAGAKRDQLGLTFGFFEADLLQMHFDEGNTFFRGERQLCKICLVFEPLALNLEANILIISSQLVCSTF